MAPLTILVCPNQELMVPEVSVCLLVLKDYLQKLLLFSPSYTYLLILSYPAVLVQKLKASGKLCGDTIGVTKRVSLERLKKERGVRVVFQPYHCRGESKVFPHVPLRITLEMQNLLQHEKTTCSKVNRVWSTPVGYVVSKDTRGKGLRLTRQLQAFILRSLER